MITPQVQSELPGVVTVNAKPVRLEEVTITVNEGRKWRKNLDCCLGNKARIVGIALLIFGLYGFLVGLALTFSHKSDPIRLGGGAALAVGGFMMLAGICPIALRRWFSQDPSTANSV